MDPRERAQLPFSLTCKHHTDAPGVLSVGNTVQQPNVGHAVDEFNGGVVADKKVASYIAHSCRVRTGKAPDREQRLMLLWRQALPLRGGFAECEKSPQLIAKLGKCGVISIVHRILDPRCGRA